MRKWCPHVHFAPMIQGRKDVGRDSTASTGRRGNHRVAPHFFPPPLRSSPSPSHSRRPLPDTSPTYNLTRPTTDSCRFCRHVNYSVAGLVSMCSVLFFAHNRSTTHNPFLPGYLLSRLDCLRDTFVSRTRTWYSADSPSQYRPLSKREKHTLGRPRNGLFTSGLRAAERPGLLCPEIFQM